MATALKQLTIALGLLASDPSALGPKLGLSDYVWNVRKLGPCKAASAMPCLLLSSKWDWKRPQGYSVFVIRNGGAEGLALRLVLNNQDRIDDDMVCLVLIATSKDGQLVGARFLSYEVLSQHSFQEQVSLQIARGFSADRLEIGSKQCDETYAQDENAARRVLSRQ